MFDTLANEVELHWAKHPALKNKKPESIPLMDM